MQESTKILLYGFLASVLLIALCLYQHRSEFVMEKAQNQVVMGQKINDINFINHNGEVPEQTTQTQSIKPVISQKPPLDKIIDRNEKTQVIESTKTKEVPVEKKLLEVETTSTSVVIIPKPTLAQLHIDAKEKLQDVKQLTKEEVDTQKAQSVVSKQVDKNLAITDNKPLIENNKVVNQTSSKSEVQNRTLPKVNNDSNNVSTETQDKISKLINHKISFYRNKAKLTSNAKKILDQTILLLKKSNPKKITVEGYTDASGKRAMNKWISLERAKSVKYYMVKHGIASKTITTVGFGEDKLLYKNKPYSRLNRRVEIKITEE